MALEIETFSNAKGGNAFFKAIGHPLAYDRSAALFGRLAEGRVAIYDPLGYAAGFAALYPLDEIEIAGLYVQDLADLGRETLGQRAQPVTDLSSADAEIVFVTAFDAEALVRHIEHLLPVGAKGRAEVVTLDALRLPDAMLATTRPYVSGLNFATNLVFFRDGDGHHTRLVTANYWTGYGAQAPALYCRLLDSEGRLLAEWQAALGAAGETLVIDSAEVRARFDLGPFAGQLFVHVLKPAGHDIVKYALDLYGDGCEILSATHDANAWPADLYAGLPAPRSGERVLLWVQNSHPRPIPAGAIGLNRMGRAETRYHDQEVAAFGTAAIDVGTLLPDLAWPDQIEIQAGKHFVRPRYEVVAAGGRRLMAHANVERRDLVPDPGIAELANLLGKSYLLPAPILPRERFASFALPTPMATSQNTLPLAVIAFDPEGREVARESLGALPRGHDRLVDLETLVNGEALPWGHFELVYDFAQGGEADGWLHALFRYEDRHSGHAAESSFGAHIFNSVLTYKGEPQSYAGRPPGLSTRLFLRLGPAPLGTFCHLIYPASTPWLGESETALILHDGGGRVVAEAELAIPCGGSRFWRPEEVFDAAALAASGSTGYVIVRDTTCRLFGYHGLESSGPKGAFSLDHMFGF